MQEVLEIQEQLDAEKGSRGGWHGWIEMFQGPRMMYRIILGVVLQALQQLTGANYFFYYVRLATVGSVHNNNPKLTPIRGRSSSTVPESVTHLSHR